MLSIIMSSYKRLPYLRRTLFSLNKNQPKTPWEIVICDENSEDSNLIVDELNKYNFKYKFVQFNVKLYEKKTGQSKFYNNPSVTNNLAFLHSEGDVIALLGNDIIITDGCLENVIDETKAVSAKHYILYTTTYNCKQEILNHVGEYGELLEQRHIDMCKNDVLQSINLKTIVTNYLSVSPRETWNWLRGYDVEYYNSIAAEDSDFSRRVFAIPESFNKVLPYAITLHQDHPTPRISNQEFWNEGLTKARKYYNSWDGNYTCKQTWPMLNYGVTKIICSK